jgi:hypothetical protein
MGLCAQCGAAQLTDYQQNLIAWLVEVASPRRECMSSQATRSTIAAFDLNQNYHVFTSSGLLGAPVSSNETACAKNDRTSQR